MYRSVASPGYGDPKENDQKQQLVGQLKKVIWFLFSWNFSRHKVGQILQTPFLSIWNQLSEKNWKNNFSWFRETQCGDFLIRHLEFTVFHVIRHFELPAVFL